MLDRLRKRIENLLQGTATAESDEAHQAFLPEEEGFAPGASIQYPGRPSGQLEAAMAARVEARKREARLILAERAHNRASTLMGELRNELLQKIQYSLDDQVGSQSLRDLLQVTLDPTFTRTLDAEIETQVGKLLHRLEREFSGDQAPLLPSPGELAEQLKSYRDQILRTHMLEQLEVYALPSLSSTFPEGQLAPEKLREKIGQYWAACREALDRFSRSVEMTILNGARPGLRLDAAVVRERLLAAQYRNGYRVLEERLRGLYGKIASLQMSAPDRTEKGLPVLDRQIVDQVIVPLAFFIRDRAEPEPREALRTRAELFREIVDKLVASREPFGQTAEAIKPLLRRSIEQARPLALESFSYLRPAIESLKPAEIHRATALLHLFETLLLSNLDEKELEKVEMNVRLNKTQYHLYLQIARLYPSLLERLQPLDRIDPSDAEFLSQILEETDPPAAAVEDLAIRLGYLPFPRELPDDPPALARALALFAISRHELTAWRFLYDPQPLTQERLERLAQAVLRQLRPTGVGADERQSQLAAVPLPVDLSRALAEAGLGPGSGGGLKAFRKELHELITSGTPVNLARALNWLQRLRTTMDDERKKTGAIGTDAEPYRVEVWMKESGAMVGLLFYHGSGFGVHPLESIFRESPADNRQEVDQNIRRQLQNQALIYQAFYRLFHRSEELSRARRMALPAYLKVVYERIEPSRHALLAHLRNAQLLIRRIEEFSSYVLEADAEARAEASAVAQILSGLSRKIGELYKSVENTTPGPEIVRFAREHERVLKYLNVAVLHSINPWLARHTQGLGTDFDFRFDEVEENLRREAEARGLRWDRDVESCEAHPIRGTLGCRALLRLVDGSSKVVLLDYDRRRRTWQVKHFGPRISDVVKEALRSHGRDLPDDYDEKHEQPTFSLEEQSCRFLMVKRGVARIESTLVLDTSREDKPWVVAFLKWNDQILVDRAQRPSSASR